MMVIDTKGFFEHTPVLTFGQFSGHAHELKDRSTRRSSTPRSFYEHTLVRTTVGQPSGRTHELKNQFHDTFIDAKEFFEHTPALTFGQFPGHTHDLEKRLHVMVIGAKGFFEYTLAVFRANAKPAQSTAFFLFASFVLRIFEEQ